MAVLTEQELEQVYDENEYTVGLRHTLLGIVLASSLFAVDPAYFADIGTRLQQIEDGVTAGDETDIYRARKLVGAVDKISEIGPGELKIRGNEDAAYITKREEREAWIVYATGALYLEGPDPRDYLPGGLEPVLQGSGPAVVVQRKGPYPCGCTTPPCGCRYPFRLARDG